ncbi:MAG: anti-sigma factor family protein [Bacillota bacterium]|jgi:Zn-finger nucleic acid-binding protein
MPCLDKEDLLSAYLDHELLPDENNLVEIHLKQCPSCREAYEDLKETSSLIRSLPDVPIPAGFQEQLHERLVQANEELYGKKKRQFDQGWFFWLIKSYRPVSVALVIFLCIAAYSFIALQKNLSSTDQTPAVFHAELAMDQADSLSVMEASQESLRQNNENQTNSIDPKEMLVYIFGLAAVVILVGAKVFSKFRKMP